MASSPFSSSLCLAVIFFPLLVLQNHCEAKTVTYDFNVTWVHANPLQNGAADRKVVGINGQWPLPVIEVDGGDRLVVNMYNGLGDKDTSIHFHGQFQNQTNFMDGPAMVTQCPIPPGASYTYNFTVNLHGTYWYHCHVDSCYPDGYRQALVVHDKDAYFSDMYDEELILTMSDWYEQLVEDIPFITLRNPTGAEPLPNGFLLNDTQNSSISVQPGLTYLMRVINIGAFVSSYFYIEDHTFRIVEVDGVYTDPAEADLLYVAVAQRYSLLVTMKNSTAKNYPIVTVADSTLLDTIPLDLQLNNTNWLEYNDSAPHPNAVMAVNDSTQLYPFDDITLVPHDRIPLLPEADQVINVTVYMNNLGDGASYAFLDNVSYTKPKVPTLYSVFSGGDANLSTNPEIYGEYTHPNVLEHNKVIDIILNNADTGSHPFHLHGHNFQLLARDPPYGERFFDYADLSSPVPYNPSNHSRFLTYPARRDTFVLPPMGSFVIRFVADNPGVWIFHCHIDWHLTEGLAMLMIEAPLQLQQQRGDVPEDHLEACRHSNMSYRGNAAGHMHDLLDLSGQNEQVPALPAGFTARGIIALVFSCISAILGMVFITFYSLAGLPANSSENRSETASRQGPRQGGTGENDITMTGVTTSLPSSDTDVRKGVQVVI